MAKCEKCGKTYYTKECINCKNKFKSTPHNQIIKKKNNVLIKSFIATILIISISGYVLYSLYEIYNLKNENLGLQKEVNLLKNKIIEADNNKFKDNLIAHYQRDNKRLALELHRTKQNIRYLKENRYVKQENRTTQRTNNKPIRQNYTYKKPSNHKQIVLKKKMYQSFSNNIKLVSDSKITKQHNNRLVSNSPIYGIYKPANWHMYKVYNAKCNDKANRYNIVDECSVMTIQGGDKLYTTEMRINELKKFDSNTHMIECLYDQNFGIMHDCKIKIFS